jgi:cytidylate kinase
MFVCTIAAEAGTGGDAVARLLADHTGAQLLDRRGLLALAHEVDPAIDDLEYIEERIGSRLTPLALGLSFTQCSPELVRELGLRTTMAGVAKTVFARAAAGSAVIVAPGGFAGLREHPSAVHLRLRAPFEWRVESYRRSELVDRHAAEKAVKHDDHLKHALVKTLYHLDNDDPGNYSLVVDASRMPAERIAGAVLAAAGLDALAAV